jgi:hypothetical protein
MCRAEMTIKAGRESQMTNSAGRIVRWAWRYLTFAAWADGFSDLSPADRQRRRASWPGWRRSIRPIGLTSYWLGVVYFTANSDHRKTLTFVALYGAWIAVWLTCALIGLADRRRYRRLRRQGPARLSRYSRQRAE